jgi:hypothetical protein
MQSERVPLSLIFPFFHPYHAHEVVPKTHEHAFHPYPWDSGNEDMTTMEYCLDETEYGLSPI